MCLSNFVLFLYKLEDSRSDDPHEMLLLFTLKFRTQLRKSAVKTDLVLDFIMKAGIEWR